jgi:hypothetical protein
MIKYFFCVALFRIWYLYDGIHIQHHKTKHSEQEKITICFGGRITDILSLVSNNLGLYRVVLFRCGNISI